VFKLGKKDVITESGGAFSKDFSADRDVIRLTIKMPRRRDTDAEQLLKRLEAFWGETAAKWL
jgi:hypothetical protein